MNPYRDAMAHVDSWISAREGSWPTPTDGKDHPIPGCPVDDLCASAADDTIQRLLAALEWMQNCGNCKASGTDGWYFCANNHAPNGQLHGYDGRDRCHFKPSRWEAKSR